MRLADRLLHPLGRGVGEFGKGRSVDRRAHDPGPAFQGRGIDLEGRENGPDVVGELELGTGHRDVEAGKPPLEDRRLEMRA